jgi:hypothetical protein
MADEKREKEKKQKVTKLKKFTLLFIAVDAGVMGLIFFLRKVKPKAK